MRFPTIDGAETVLSPIVELKMRLWWLSFCDESRRAGQQSLGVCIVEGFDIGWATAEAHRMGCNPGGQVWGIEVPEHMETEARKRYPINKLMSRAEIETIDGAACITLAEIEARKPPHRKRRVEKRRQRRLADQVRKEAKRALDVGAILPGYDYTNHPPGKRLP